MVTKASDIMTTSVFSVSPSMLLSDLEWEFSRRRISGAPVIEEGKLVGMISRADIVRRIGFSHAMSDMALDYYRQLEGALEGDHPKDLERLADQTLGSQLRTLLVRDAMTTHPATVTPQQSAAEIAKLMLEQSVHRVLVTEHSRVLGVVSTLDLVRLLAEGP